MCMKYAMGAGASPVPAPAADAAIVNVMEEDDVRCPFWLLVKLATSSPLF